MTTLTALKFRLEEERRKRNIPWNILEQDYLLSWILAGISLIPELKANLAFKGGTALKKCYFGDYRFSEDLDFTFIGAPQEMMMVQALLVDACMMAQRRLEEHLPSPTITIERYVEKQPHPDGQLAFVIRAQLPWHRTPMVRVMVEITMAEEVVLPLEERPILHAYGEHLPETVLTYTLEEIVAEKLRAILQYTKKIHEQGWARSRSRDFYDLWRIFNSFDEYLNYDAILPTLQAKCATKSVTFTSAADFFQPRALAEVETTWDVWLKPLVSNLPTYHTVLTDLQTRLPLLLESRLEKAE